MERGALWHAEPLTLLQGFETSFGFRAHNQSLCTRQTAAGCNGSYVGGGGFSFVVHSDADGAWFRLPDTGAAGCGATALPPLGGRRMLVRELARPANPHLPAVRGREADARLAKAVGAAPVRRLAPELVLRSGQVR